MRRWLSTLAALLLVGTAPAARNVLVVDAGAGAGSGYTTIQAAIDAAADGDVVLVRPGGYAEALTMHAKSLVLHGDPGIGTPPVIQQLVIDDVGAGQSVEVRGFVLEPGAGAQGDLITVTSCAGSVWLEELATHPSRDNVPGRTLYTEDSDSVVVSRCTFGRIIGVLYATSEPPAVESVRSTLHVFDSTIAPQDVAVVPEQPGIRAEGPGELGIYQSSVTGTIGKKVGFSHGGCSSTQTGDGVDLIGDVALFVQDSDIQAGSLGGCGGVQGQAIVAGTGPVTLLASKGRTHRVSSPVRDDELVHVELEGEPSDVAYVFYSFDPRAPLFLRKPEVPLLLAAPTFLAATVALPASGSLIVDLPVGDVPPELASIVLEMQVLFVGTTAPKLVLSEPTSVTALDAAY